MGTAFSKIAFTDSVRRQQQENGSAETYASLDTAGIDRGDKLTEVEASFIQARDGFYQATVSETGWPYVQFRGGPAGFLKVLDAQTLAYADFRGNRQYISSGNLTVNDRVTLILMDYPNRTRLKIWARAQQLPISQDPELTAKVTQKDYRGLPERIVVLTLEAFDWNCPQHIPRRFTLAELAPDLAALRNRLRQLEEENTELKAFLKSSG